MSTTRHTNPYEPVADYPDEYLEKVIEYPGPAGKEQQSEGGRTPQNQILEEPDKTAKSKELLSGVRQDSKLKRSVFSSYNIIKKRSNIL